MKKWKAFEASWKYVQDDPNQILEDKLNEIERAGWNIFEILVPAHQTYFFTIVAWKPSEDSTNQD